MTSFGSLNMPSLGKYASVIGELPYTDVRIPVMRGYGNIVVHNLKQNGNLETTVTPYNRLQPLGNPYGTHLPQSLPKSKYDMFNSQSTIAWDLNPKYV